MPGTVARRPVQLVVVLIMMLLLAGAGCAQGKVGSVSRDGGRDLDASDTGVVETRRSLTIVPVDQRQPAPVASGPALSGNGTVSTDAFPGKVVVINVWGSWCAPCRLEARDLADASRETRKIAAFVGINIRDPSPETARAFVRTFDVPYPHIYDPNAEQLLRFSGALPPSGIPSTLIVDKQGRIAVRIIGVVDKKTLVGLIGDTAQGR